MPSKTASPSQTSPHPSVLESTRTIKASSGAGDIPVFSASSGEGLRPGFLLVPAIFGIDEGTKDLVRDVAALGVHAWVVDPFWNTSTPGIIARDGDGFKNAIARARTLDDKTATLEFADVIEAMGKEEGCTGKVVVAGLCFAGKFALFLTHGGEAAAGASFHGARMVPHVDLAKDIKAPLSLHFGDADVAIPVDDVHVLREAFKDHDNVDIFLHEGGVQHGFADPGSDGFNPDVYQKALAEIKRLLDGAC